MICRNGFVNIHDEAGEIIVEFGTSPTGTSVRGVRKSGAISDYELVDSLFALTGRPAGSLIALKLHDTGWAARAGYSLAFSWSRSELDGFPVKDRGRFMDMRRDFRVYVDSGGQDTLYDYDVSRMSLDGGAELKLATYGPLSVQISDRP